MSAYFSLGINIYEIASMVPKVLEANKSVTGNLKVICTVQPPLTLQSSGHKDPGIGNGQSNAMK